ncbi:MAG: flavoprotein [Kiritimatiellae bacterium]|nr:flavoprotein [Kiritimatiellia bacterium]
MNKRKTPEIVLGVSGSIAAYKAAELVRLMVKRQWRVSVVMTPSATRFVTPLTFQTLSRNPVVVDHLDVPETWMPEHIALADRADVLAVAPCTANVLAKLAHGLADDALTATALACRAPLVIAPAMNDGMWANPATQANVETMRARGAHMVAVGSGDLACGRVGEGRMAEVADIFAAVEQLVG